MTISFLGIIIGSLMDNSENGKQECAAYEAQDVRCQTGIGAEGQPVTNCPVTVWDRLTAGPESVKSC